MLLSMSLFKFRNKAMTNRIKIKVNVQTYTILYGNIRCYDKVEI